MRKELEDRLVNLSLKINQLCKHLDGSFMSDYLMKQVIRSSSSAAMNYGEAQGAESRGDFIHKVSITLKELRETLISLKLISGLVKANARNDLDSCIDECSQLVSIFHKTVISAKANR